MKLVLLLLMCWFISVSVKEPISPRAVFGVKVSIGANSEVTSYVCYLYDGRTLSQKKMVDKESFVKIVSGHWPSIYNPKRQDYFEEHNIDCSILVDPITRKTSLGCAPFDSLWKIHFGTYPFQNNSEPGWGNKYHRPSPKQEKYLFNRYGIRRIEADYFLDTNFWMILNDVTDQDWINNYKSLY